jgi:hypothetical protein
VASAAGAAGGRARAACITILVALRFSRLTPQVRALIRTPCQAGARPLRLQWLDYLLPSARCQMTSDDDSH